MKILFLTHRLPFAPNRGDRIRAYYLLQAMSRFAEVSLFSLTHDSSSLSPLWGGLLFAAYCAFVLALTAVLLLRRDT